MAVTKRRNTRGPWAVAWKLLAFLGAVFLIVYVFSEPHTVTHGLQGVFLLVCVVVAGVLVYRALRSR